MLAIRLQRFGRKTLPIYRLIIQDAQKHPSSGRVVAYAGTYNPHTKDVALDKEKITNYLKNGAQPTPRVVRILAEQKIELPDWVKKPATDKKRAVRKPAKLRKNQPKAAKAVELDKAETISAEVDAVETSAVEAKE